ncbi:TlpA family protein disulfide reductase [Candidatus Omnitrophota bacterium]
MKLLLTVLLVFTFSSSSFGAKYANIENEAKDFIKYINDVKLPKKVKVDIVTLRIGRKNSTIFNVKLKRKYLEGNKIIFVFSADDTQTIEMAKEVNADYGICVDCDDREDLNFFRNETDVKYPIILGDGSLAEIFQITAYPAVVIIRDGALFAS